MYKLKILLGPHFLIMCYKYDYLHYIFKMTSCKWRQWPQDNQLLVVISDILCEHIYGIMYAKMWKIYSLHKPLLHTKKHK